MISIYLRDYLKRGNIKVSELHKWDRYLRGMWENTFAGHLSENEKKSIHMNQFLWHLFKKVDHLIKSEARSIFNEIEKSTCYIFYQDRNTSFICEDSSRLKSEFFDEENDIYIVDKDYSWTYVNTHEDQCGPYLLEKRIKRSK